MKSITTFIRALYNKPALVSEDYADAVFTALENKDLSFFGNEIEIKDKEISVTELRGEVVEGGSRSSESLREPNKAALLEIEGALTYKRQLSHSGMSSYQGMKAAFRSLLSDPSITTWVMDLSTQGGMAYQCFETARFIRKLADDNNKTLIAYVDGQAASAGYALASVAHEVISNPMSSVGSIGVVVTLKNDLPKELADGKERIFITYGSEKRPFTETGNIKKEKLAEIQADVDALGKEFDGHVANFRGMSEADVKKLGARSFNVDKALELGLIDKIMEREEFLSYVSSLLTEEVPKPTTSKESENLSDQNDTLKELQAKFDVLEANSAKLAATNETLGAENKKLSGVLTKLAEDQAAVKHTKLVAKLSEFSFVEDSDVVAKVLSVVDEEGKNVLMTSFEAAQTALNKKEKDEKEAEDNKDMFELTSTGLNEDLADLSDIGKEVDKILEAKHGGAK